MHCASVCKECCENPAETLSRPACGEMEVAMTHEQVQTWLDAYVAAWRSYDEAAIRALFAVRRVVSAASLTALGREGEGVARAWVEQVDRPMSRKLAPTGK